MILHPSEDYFIYRADYVSENRVVPMRIYFLSTNDVDAFNEAARYSDMAFALFYCGSIAAGNFNECNFVSDNLLDVRESVEVN